MLQQFSYISFLFKPPCVEYIHNIYLYMIYLYILHTFCYIWHVLYTLYTYICIIYIAYTYICIYIKYIPTYIQHIYIICIQYIHIYKYICNIYITHTIYNKVSMLCMYSTQGGLNKKEI